MSRSECDAVKEWNCAAANNGHNGSQEDDNAVENVSKQKGVGGTRWAGGFIQTRLQIHLVEHAWTPRQRLVREAIPLGV